MCGLALAVARARRDYQRVRRTVGIVLLVAASACTSSSRHSVVDPRLGPGRPTALDACRRWDSVTGMALPLPREAAALNDVVRLANDATNQNLVYVLVRDHVGAVVQADGAGDRAAADTARRVVNNDCRRIREGKAPTGLIGG